MSVKSASMIICTIWALSGCGTSVPRLTSSNADNSDQLFVTDVHLAIRCELIDAIREADRQARAIDTVRGNSTASRLFASWGVKYTVTLQTIENSSGDLSLGLTSNISPSSGDTVATIGAGLGGTAKATRTEIDQSFSTAKLYSLESQCEESSQSKIAPNGSNLGIKSWLLTRMSLIDSGIIGSITVGESFSYRVQFDITQSANLAPAWTFVQTGLNSTRTPLSAARSTSHTVLVTVGPAQKSRAELAEGAAAVHDAIISGSFGDIQ